MIAMPKRPASGPQPRAKRCTDPPFVVPRIDDVFWIIVRLIDSPRDYFALTLTCRDFGRLSMTEYARKWATAKFTRVLATLCDEREDGGETAYYDCVAPNGNLHGESSCVKNRLAGGCSAVSLSSLFHNGTFVRTKIHSIHTGNLIEEITTPKPGVHRVLLEYHGAHARKGQVRRRVPVVDGRWHGIAKTYYDNGMIYGESEWRDGVQCGVAKTYYTDRSYVIQHWDNGQETGPCYRYAADGRIREIGYKVSGKWHGLFAEISRDGTVLLECHYHNGVLHGDLNRYDSNPMCREHYQFGKMIYPLREPSPPPAKESGGCCVQ